MTSENRDHLSDRATLEELNQEYVSAFMNANVGWYREHLAVERVHGFGLPVFRLLNVHEGPYWQRRIARGAPHHAADQVY